MCVEELDDPATGVLSRFVVVTGLQEKLAEHHHVDGHLVVQPPVVVEERVSRFGVLLHVVRYPDLVQRRLELGRRSAQRSVAAAVGADNRTGTREEGRVIRVLRCRSVVHARCREAVAGREEECETPAHAEPDHADSAGAVLLRGQPIPHCVDLLERTTLASPQVTEDRADAGHLAAPSEEVWCRDGVTGAGQPFGLGSEVVRHPESVVDHDDAGAPAAADRVGDVGRNLPMRGGNHDGRHRPSLSHGARTGLERTVWPGPSIWRPGKGAVGAGPNGARPRSIGPWKLGMPSVPDATSASTTIVRSPTPTSSGSWRPAAGRRLRPTASRGTSWSRPTEANSRSWPPSGGVPATCPEPRP